MRWCVYMVRCNDGSLYTGITTDVERRINQHNGLSRGGASYTRGRRPVALVFTDFRNDRADASRLECRIKKLNRADKDRLLAGSPLPKSLLAKV